MPIHRPPRRTAPPSAHRTTPVVTKTRRAGRPRYMSVLGLAATLLPIPVVAAAGDARDAEAVLPGGAADRPYSEVHLLRSTVNTTNGGDSGRQVVDSWRWRNNLDGSGLLHQVAPAAAPTAFPPGALRLWSGHIQVPTDPDGLRRFLTDDTAPDPTGLPAAVLARIADLSSVYCPTPGQRATVVGLLNDLAGPPTRPGGPIDTYTVAVTGTRWTLTVQHDTNALLSVETVDVPVAGTTHVQHTDYLSCRRTNAPLAAANRSAA